MAKKTNSVRSAKNSTTTAQVKNVVTIVLYRLSTSNHNPYLYILLIINQFYHI